MIDNADRQRYTSGRVIQQEPQRVVRAEQQMMFRSDTEDYTISQTDTENLYWNLIQIFFYFDDMIFKHQFLMIFKLIDRYV